MPVISRSVFERLYFTDKHYLKMIPDIGGFLSAIVSSEEFKKAFYGEGNIPREDMASEIGKYFPNRKVSGKKIEGSQAVISQMQLQQKMVYYITDPALERLAQKYTEPGSRASLTKAEGLVRENGKQIKKEISTEDPHLIDIERLKREYQEAKKEIEKEGPQLVQ